MYMWWYVKMNVRQRTEKLEQEILSNKAALSKNSMGRDVFERPCNLRTVYQCDRDRIIHSKAFRRLKHKTQVFISPNGDHYHTRLTHTLEVAQIARTISRALLLNEDLTEAIALGHDLGHTPFGHAGEDCLNLIYKNGFHHYEQSVRVVEKLEKNNKGLNLTKEVRNGILCHTKGEQAWTVEGRVVRISDKIAYINHDIDDAVRGEIIKIDDIPKDIIEILGNNRSQRINTMVNSLVENSIDGNLRMSEDVEDAFKRVHDFMYERVYLSEVAKSEESKVPYVLEGLYKYFCENPKKLPEDMLVIARNEGTHRAVCDYIAGMTDQYAVRLFGELFIPKSWKIS